MEEKLKDFIFNNLGKIITGILIAVLGWLFVDGATKYKSLTTETRVKELIQNRCGPIEVRLAAQEETAAALKKTLTNLTEICTETKLDVAYIKGKSDGTLSKTRKN